MADKKDVERWQLDQFVAACPGFPAGTILSSEEPDFIVDTGENKIGIELTDLYWSGLPGRSSRQAQEALRRRVCEPAKREWIAKGRPNLHVSLYFARGHIFKKTEVNVISTRIVEFVDRHIPEVRCSYEEDNDWINRKTFPQELDSIRIYRLPSMQEPVFSAPDSGFLPDLEEDDIVRTIRRKETRLRGYRVRCAEVWLVINYNSGQLSRMFALSDDVVAQVYESSFNRVFLMSLIGRRANELRLQKND